MRTDTLGANADEINPSAHTSAPAMVTCLVLKRFSDKLTNGPINK